MRYTIKLYNLFIVGNQSSKLFIVENQRLDTSFKYLNGGNFI